MWNLMNGIALLVIFAASAYGCLFLQAGGAASPDLFSQIERLGLTSAALVAVVVLYSAQQKREAAYKESLSIKDAAITEKDKLVVDMVRQMMEVLTATKDSSVELRRVIEDSVAAKQVLTRAVDALHAELKLRPCLAEDHSRKR